jgi:hypothetical protein
MTTLLHVMTGLSSCTKPLRRPPAYAHDAHAHARPPPPKFIDGTPPLTYVLEFARWIWIFLAEPPMLKN